jgi:ribosome-binding protein aMBF1 (putative translation factor)
VVRKTRDAVKILDQLTGDDIELQRMIEEEYVNIQVAQMIYDARVSAGLTQIQLAELIGTHQSTIARLEDSDYRGHSLNMLKRIASALHLNLEVRFIPRSVA